MDSDTSTDNDNIEIIYKNNALNDLNISSNNDKNAQQIKSTSNQVITHNKIQTNNDYEIRIQQMMELQKTKNTEMGTNDSELNHGGSKQNRFVSRKLLFYQFMQAILQIHVLW